MTLKELQREIRSNRIRRGWPSADQLDKTSLGLLEEAGEFEHARKRNDHAGMVDALGDLLVFCLGGLEILGEDAQVVLERIVAENAGRDHTGHH